MKHFIQLLFVVCLTENIAAQTFTSYIIGDIENSEATPTRGIVLAGGATDNDNAMKWMLERANGGDVLVLRASGGDGYNDYFFSDLDITVNSVETIVCNYAASSSEPYILQRIAEAECIFFAGGDQWDYIDFWMNTEVENALNDFIHIKQGVMGGTSAGMAVLGGHIFTAENGTVTSNSALNNPFGLTVTMSHDDFLTVPFLENVVTDTHYDDPDRRGRHMTFMAQMSYVGCSQPLGIACNEYVAVAIDANGIAHCFGEYPQYQEFVYFLRQGCESPANPEVIEPLEALTWNRNQSALKVYRANGRLDGSSTFDLNDWLANSGDGQWQNWWVEQGNIFFTENAQAPECVVSVSSSLENTDLVRVEMRMPATVDVKSYITGRCLVVDVLGRVLLDSPVEVGSQSYTLRNIRSGIYAVVVLNADGISIYNNKICWIDR